MIKPGAIWKELFKNLTRKPITVLYPKERHILPPNFRGKPVYDPTKCNGCLLCMKDCPAEAVKIEKVGDNAFQCTFYLGRCLYCGQCADSCNKSAITMSQIFELAAFEQGPMIDVTKPVIGNNPVNETKAAN